MSAITNLYRRIVAALRRSRLDDELREEMAQHVAWRAESLMADGLPEAEARRRAAVGVGNLSRLREESRAVWGFPTVDSVGQDARYGIRQIRRAPVVAAVAVASLAVAIGAGSAVFALARAALYREGGIVRPQDVLMLRWQSPSGANLFNSFNGSSSFTDVEQGGTSFAYPTLRHLSETVANDADVAGFADVYGANLSVRGEPRVATGQFVSGSYFALLGVRPAAGRLLQPADDDPSAEAIVISHRLWSERFGGRAEAIGSSVQVNGVAFTIVGVAAPSFRGSLEAGTLPDIYVPFGARDRVAHDGEAGTDQNYWWVRILARPRPGVPADALRARAEAVFRADTRAARPALQEASLPILRVVPGGYGDPDTREGLRDPLRVLFLAIAVLLLIACTNVAGLQVARAAAREREMAVRLAMGASRGRLLRQVVTESLMMALAGGVAGLFLAQGVAHALLPALNFEPDAALDLGVDWIVAGFAMATAFASGILLGLAPAWRASGARASIVSAGSLAGRGSAESPRLRLGRALLVGQMALSLALVFAALLFVQSLRHLEGVAPGFDTRNLVLFRVNPLLNGYEPPRVRQYWREGLENIRRLPGVAHATITTHPLIANSSSSSDAYVRASDGTEKSVLAYRMSVGDDFFPAMGIPIRSGRAIDARDAGPGVLAAVINETMARAAFGQAAPLGARFRLSKRPGAPEYEVVGIAADARYSSLRRKQPAIAYLSLLQNPSPGDMTIYVRTAAGGSIAGALTETMQHVDAAVPVFGLRTQEEQIARYLAQERFFASLGTTLGAAALLLACIGLYGLLSYAVTRRTPELGVRLALGASPRRLAADIVRESLALAAAGAVIGVPAAYALGRTAESSLFGVSPASPGLFAVSVAVIAAVSLIVAWVPARRASHVDPLVALRTD